MKKYGDITKYFIAILMFANLQAYSQEYVFSVLAKSGDVQIQKKNMQEWINASTGQKLLSGDLIRLGSKSYLGLVHSSLNTVELNNGGVYFVDQLEGRVNQNQSTLTRKFTAFIMEEMAVPKDKSKNMKSLGAVVRLSKMRIDVNLPQNTNFLDSIFTFCWYPNPETKKYIFQLLNPSDNTIYMSEISDTSLTLNLNELNLLKDEKYKWLIFNSEQPEISSDTTFFSVKSKANKKNIQDELIKLGGDLQDDKALGNLIKASFFRHYGFYLDAIEKYKKALALEPSVEEYWSNYLQFLIDVGLKRFALYEWNRSTFAIK